MEKIRGESDGAAGDDEIRSIVMGVFEPLVGKLEQQQAGLVANLLGWDLSALWEGGAVTDNAALFRVVQAASFLSFSNLPSPAVAQEDPPVVIVEGKVPSVREVAVKWSVRGANDVNRIRISDVAPDATLQDVHDALARSQSLCSLIDGRDFVLQFCDRDGVWEELPLDDQVSCFARSRARARARMHTAHTRRCQLTRRSPFGFCLGPRRPRRSRPCRETPAQPDWGSSERRQSAR